MNYRFDLGSPKKEEVKKFQEHDEQAGGTKDIDSEVTHGRGYR